MPYDTEQPSVGGWKKAPWRNEELNNRLIELYKLNLSFAIISERLTAEFAIPVTRNACIGRVARLGLDPRPHVQQIDGKTSKRKPRKPREPGEPKIAIKPRRIYYCDPVELSQVNADALHLTVTELEREQCRYPFGDEKITFCGLRTFDGSSYCEMHWRVTHQAPRESGSQVIRRTNFNMIVKIQEAA